MMGDASRRFSTQEYLHLMGVPDLPRLQVLSIPVMIRSRSRAISTRAGILWIP